MGGDLKEQLQQSLGEAYTLERELGGGGMSRVFLAAENALGRTVVVKVLAPELAAGVSVDRFQREIQLAAKLQHPHIVPLLHAGVVSGLPYYTMPFVEGESLRSRLARAGALPVAEAVAVLRDVALALAYAHEHAVVHRDIKPENILLSGGSAVVTDFGIAKALTLSQAGPAAPTLTQTGTSVGSPAYMAPEQASGDPAGDLRIDLYAWGLVAYEILAGTHPFGGRTTLHAMVLAHLSETPVHLEASGVRLPPGLSDVVMRCLAKQASARPDSAREVLSALEALSSPQRGTASGPGRSRRLAWSAAAALAVVLGSLFLWRWRDPARGSGMPAIAIRSLAVLPFVNVGGDSAQDYFADGMTDELTSALGRTAGLRVASRSSAYTFKGKPGLDVREAGRRLGVGAVVEGTVRRYGSRLRVTAQLTTSADRLGLWTQSFERDAGDIFAVQDEIAAAIVGALQITMGVVKPRRAGRTRSVSPELYDLYLRGRHLANLATRESLERSLEYFRTIVAKDPSYAPAHVGIAFSYSLLADAYLPPERAYPLMISAARRAARMDDSLAEAHSLLAAGAMYEWDWGAVAVEIERTRALNPSDPSVPQTVMMYRLMLADSTGAAAAGREWVQLDPLNGVANHLAARNLALAGALDSAIVQARRAEEVAPDFVYGDAWTGYVYLAGGMIDSALSRFERVAHILGRPTPGLAKAYAAAGRRAEAKAVLRDLESRWKTEYVFTPDLVAEAWATLGDYERAFIWLERSIDVRSVGAPLITIIPEFSPMRPDPRFTRLLQRLNLRIGPDGRVVTLP